MGSTGPWRLPVLLVALTLTAGGLSACSGTAPEGGQPATSHSASPSPASPSPASPSPAVRSPTGSGGTAAQPLHLAVMGDSLAFGSFATTAARSYRLLLVNDLSRTRPVQLDTGFRLVNVDNLSLVRSLVTVPSGLDVAVLELGSNDGRHGTPLDVFENDYDQMLDRVQGSSPHVQLVCIGVWWSTDQSFAAGTAADYDAAISRSCHRHSGAFVGLRDLFDNTALRGPAGRMTYRGKTDGYHPNDAGHAAIAARLLPVVQAAAQADEAP